MMMARGKNLTVSQIREIRSLWKGGEGIPILEIVDELGIPKSTVYYHTKLKDRGFRTPGAYSDHLARQNGDSSARERQNRMLGEKGLTEREYLDSLVKKNGFSSGHEMRVARLEENGTSYIKYRNRLAKRNGYCSYSEYQKVNGHRKRKENFGSIMFGTIVRKRLDKLNKTQIQASKEIGVDRRILGKWYAGETFPSERYHNDIASVLELPRMDLGDWISELEKQVEDGVIPKEIYQVYNNGRNPYHDLEEAREEALKVMDESNLISWPSFRMLYKMGYRQLCDAIRRTHGINNFKHMINLEYLKQN